MKQKTKELLQEAYKYCNEKDKSTEFMLEYMQDFANVDLDCVLNFLQTEYFALSKPLPPNETKALNKAINKHKNSKNKL